MAAGDEDIEHQIVVESLHNTSLVKPKQISEPKDKAELNLKKRFTFANKQ